MNENIGNFSNKFLESYVSVKIKLGQFVGRQPGSDTCVE